MFVVRLKCAYFITGRRTEVGLLAPAEAERGRVAIPHDGLYGILGNGQRAATLCPGHRYHGAGTLSRLHFPVVINVPIDVSAHAR